MLQSPVGGGWMLSLDTRFVLNHAEAAASVMEGEAIMMNLSKGVYYSTDAVGARIWELAAAGHSLEEIAAQLAAEYDVSLDRARTDVTRLAAQFIEESLLVPASQPNSPIPPMRPNGHPKAPYAPPQLEIYREMGHLLALDPPMPGLENISWDDPSIESHSA
ncbi:MAG TPA: PqqD family protein [Anaerolineae bacterium]|nr:PqqD family protein [Anaerolineae bacterium]